MKWLKSIFCIHEDEHFFLVRDSKMGGITTVKNGLNIGSGLKCKKCGRIKKYHYGF